MLFRRMQPADLPAILAIQEANLFANLNEAQRRDGFLSARFTAEQFAEMDRQVAVVVGEEGGTVTGYGCASSVEYNRQFPLLAAMLDAARDAPFLGNRLGAVRSMVYGPVCVAQEWRRRGVARGLYECARRLVRRDYDAGVAFIAKDNARSLAAHTDGLGMNIVGDFRFDGRGYWLIAFPVPPPPAC
jgi:L-amino acid N-acyltransferase YncA